MEKSRKRKEVEEEEEEMMWSMLKLEEEENEKDGVGINEEKIAEVMRRLEQEIIISYPTDHYHYQSSPFVTINGNEETCGPSFSDTSSTVMATFDTSTASFFLLDPAPTGSDHESTVNLYGSDPLWIQEEDEWLANVIDGTVGGLEEDDETQSVLPVC